MNNMPWHVDRREIMNPQTALSEGPRGASQNQSYIPPEMRSLEALKHKNWIRGPSLGEIMRAPGATQKKHNTLNW